MSRVLKPFNYNTMILSKWLRARWISILIFPVIIWIVGPDDLIVLETMLAFLCTCFLLWNITRYGSNALPVWAVFIIFLAGYFLKFCFLFINDGHVVNSISPFIQPLITQNNLLKAYEITILAYVVFCITSVVLMWLFRFRTISNYYRYHLTDMNIIFTKKLFIIALLLSGSLSIVTTYIQAVTGVGVMGNNVILPYRLAGIILYGRYFITYCLILLLFLTEDDRFKKIRTATMLLLFLHVLTISLLMTSRGAFIGPILGLFVMWTIMHNFTKSRLLTIICIISFVAIMHPVISNLRNVRIDDPKNFIGSVSKIGDFNKVNDGSSKSGFISIFTRITGIEQVVLSSTLADPGLDFRHMGQLLFDPQRSFSKIYTQDIEGRGNSIINHGTAPSLVGAFFVLGGAVGVGAGMATWVFLGLLCWKTIPFLFNLTSPVALGSFFSLYLSLTAEGTLDTIPLTFAVNFAMFFVGERLIRSKFMFTSSSRTH